MKNSYFMVALVAVLVIAIAGLYLRTTESKFGAVSPSDVSATNFTEITASNGALITGGLTLGTTNTITGLQFGTCTIVAYATTIAASSSAQVDCQAATNGGLTAISGIVSGDKVFAGLASTTVAISEGLHVQWAAASTTAGYITMKISNDTGGTFTWASTASSSVPYLVLR